MAEAKKKTPRRYVNARDAAALLGISEKALRIKVQKREVPFYKPNKLLRFDPDELLAFWEKYYVPAKEPSL